jgi:hypothetical protein
LFADVGFSGLTPRRPGIPEERQTHLCAGRVSFLDGKIGKLVPQALNLGLRLLHTEDPTQAEHKLWAKETHKPRTVCLNAMYVSGFWFLLLVSS